VNRNEKVIKQRASLPSTGPTESERTRDAVMNYPTKPGVRARAYELASDRQTHADPESDSAWGNAVEFAAQSGAQASNQPPLPGGAATGGDKGNAPGTTVQPRVFMSPFGKVAKSMNPNSRFSKHFGSKTQFSKVWGPAAWEAAAEARKQSKLANDSTSQAYASGKPSDHSIAASHHLRAAELNSKVADNLRNLGANDEADRIHNKVDAHMETAQKHIGAVEAWSKAHSIK
jgi:hypothetical protein